MSERSRLTRWRAAAAFRLVGPLLRRLQVTRSSQFDTIGPIAGAIVFLGDSISEGGLWSEWLPGFVTSNRGIGGQTTAQMLDRLDSAIDRPTAVFLLAGTNDLSDGASTGQIAGRIALILDGIGARAEDSPIFLQSVMPRTEPFAFEILDLNRRLRALAETRPQVRYLDLWPALASPSSTLRPAFTNDSLHLNGAGYAAWLAVIRPIVDRLG